MAPTPSSKGKKKSSPPSSSNQSSITSFFSRRQDPPSSSPSSSSTIRAPLPPPSSSSVKPRQAGSSPSSRPSKLGKTTSSASSTSSMSSISSASTFSKPRALELPPLAQSTSTSSSSSSSLSSSSSITRKMAPSPLKQQHSLPKHRTLTSDANESSEDGSDSRVRGKEAGGSKRKGAGGAVGALVFSQKSTDDESGSGGSRASARKDKGKGRESPRKQQDQQQHLPSLSKKARPSSPSPHKSKVTNGSTASSLLLPSSSSSKLSSIPAQLPSPSRRSKTPASPARESSRIDLNAPSPGRIREVIQYSPHLDAAEAALTDSDEEMEDPVVESALVPVGVAIHPPSSSPVKQSELNAAASSSSTSSAHLAREVTPDTLTIQAFGGLDSPLTPLPVRFADGSMSDDVVVVDGAEDDSDEIISSSEKGEGDAEPLRPHAEVVPEVVDGPAPMDEDQSLEEVSAILPSAPTFDESFDHPSPERSNARRSGVPSTPARDSLGDITMASSSSRTTGTLFSSPVRHNNIATSSVLANASPRTQTLAERIRREAEEAVKKPVVDSDSDLDTDSSAAAVVDELSDDSDEFEKLERENRVAVGKGKGVLTERNGTSRDPTSPIKSILRSKPTTTTSVLATPSTSTRASRSTAIGSVPRFKAPTPVSTAPGSAAARADANRFKALIKSTQERQANLDKLEQFKRTKTELSSDEDEDADDEDDATTRRGGKGKSGAYPTPSTDRHSSVSSDDDDSSSSESGESAEEETTAGLLGGEAADQIKELLGNDKSEKREEKRERREKKARGLGGWTGCWAWGNGKIKDSGVTFVEGEWNFIRLEGQSENPSFTLLMQAVALRDERAFVTYLMCGVLTRCLHFIEDKEKLLISLIETATLTPNHNLSRLTLGPALTLLAESTSQNPVIDSKTLVRLLTSAFKSTGIKADLLTSLSTSSKARAEVQATPVNAAAAQGAVFPMSETSRDRAMRCLVQVIEAAARSHILSTSAVQLFIPLLAVISLDKASSINLKNHISAALAVMIDSARTIEEEMTICHQLNELTTPFKLTFKHALLNVLPRAGKKASRLLVGLGVTFLGRTSLDEHTYITSPSFPSLVSLLSQRADKVPRSNFYIDSETDYDQLVASVKILTLVLTDLHRVYLFERRRIDLAQGVDAGMGLEPEEGEVEMKDGEAGPSGSGSRAASVAASSVGGGGGGGGLTRTQIDVMPIMSPLEEAIVDCDKKILDARAADLNRTAAKAFLLNLRMSISYRTVKYKALYLRDREGAMRLLDE